MGNSPEHTVIVMDAQGNALVSCRPARARLLLKRGAAKLLCLCPFTIQIIEMRNDGNIKSLKDHA